MGDLTETTKSTKTKGMQATKTTAVALCLGACVRGGGPPVPPLQPEVRVPVTGAAGRLVVEITSLRSDRGLVAVSVFCGPDGFPGEAERACGRARVPIAGGAAQAVFDVLPAGAFAVAVLHDEDGDGQLATNLVGYPLEGYGASRDARRTFGAPRWADARLELAAGEAKHVIVQVGY
jgi:uncharacterized protein (DUF2141 family)